MDLSFHRRRKTPPATAAPDLASLLSAVAVRQAMSPTARAQAEIERDDAPAAARDSRLALFAPDGDAADAQAPARFSPCALPPVNLRQPS